LAPGSWQLALHVGTVTLPTVWGPNCGAIVVTPSRSYLLGPKTRSARQTRSSLELALETLAVLGTPVLYPDRTRWRKSRVAPSPNCVAGTCLMPP